LTHAHGRELRLLEVGVDPYLIERNDRHQRRTGGHTLAELNDTLGDVARNRRRQTCACNVEIGIVHLRCGREHVGMARHRRAIDACLVGREFLLRCNQRRVGAGERVTRMLQLLAGNCTGACDPLAPVAVLGRLGDLGAAHVDVGLELRRRGEQSAHLADGLAELRVGLLECDLCVRRIELDQRLARVDKLGVVGGNTDHRAGDLRRDLHDVAADVGVIGRLDLTQGQRPVCGVRGADQRERPDYDNEPTLAPGRHCGGCGSLGFAHVVPLMMQ
jgi:hypothetical protein